MNVAGNLSAGVPKHRCVPLIGAWADRAACAGMDPNLWFIEERGGSYEEARAVCATCAVTTECLQWALDTRTDHGVFGGLDPRQRRKLRRLTLAESDHRRVDSIRPHTRFL